jgi:hypothetical protein
MALLVALAVAAQETRVQAAQEQLVKVLLAVTQLPMLAAVAAVAQVELAELEIAAVGVLAALVFPPLLQAHLLQELAAVGVRATLLEGVQRQAAAQEAQLVALLVLVRQTQAAVAAV